jgi:hypothetical protein
MRWRHYMPAYVWQIVLHFFFLFCFLLKQTLPRFDSTQHKQHSPVYNFISPNHLRSFSFICASSFLFHLPWATKHGLSWQTCLNHY